MAEPIRVTIWDEMTADPVVYPKGICACIAEALGAEPDMQVKVATIDDPEQGLTEAALAATDVLLWWGHLKHRDVTDESAKRVIRHVTERGMGYLPLHSAHKSKAFMWLNETDGELDGWREDDLPERIFVVEPNHPIAQGLPHAFELAQEEMYSEYFNIRTPEPLVLISSFAKGEVFRSGCCWQFGKGRAFYFRPGHESNPTYYDPNVRTILKNAVRWCANRS